MSILENETTTYTTSQIVYAHRCLQGKPGRPMPFRHFAASLGVSHETIRNWENDLYPINSRLLYRILSHNPKGWQYAFAKDLLAVLFPTIVPPFNDILQLVRQAEAFLNSKSA